MPSVMCSPGGQTYSVVKRPIEAVPCTLVMKLLAYL